MRGSSSSVASAFAFVASALVVGVAGAAVYRALDPHGHTCSRCGNQWRHFGAFNGGNERAHACGACGTIQWWKDGALPLLALPETT